MYLLYFSRFFHFAFNSLFRFYLCIYVLVVRNRNNNIRVFIYESSESIFSFFMKFYLKRIRSRAKIEIKSYPIISTRFFSDSLLICLCWKLCFSIQFDFKISKILFSIWVFFSFFKDNECHFIYCLAYNVIIKERKLIAWEFLIIKINYYVGYS